MAVKKNDFVEVEYTGKLKEDGTVFDTTDKKTAEQSEISSEKMEYGPVIVCIGHGHLIKGLDEQLIGKELGKYEIDLSPEQAFGKKSTDMIQLIPTSKFTKQGVKPMPGMQLNIDGLMGTVKTVTGGRTIIDFNHPLSGKEISYSIEMKRIVTDEKEKTEALVKMYGLKDATVEIKEKTATITIKQDIDDESKNKVIDKIKELTTLENIELTKTK